jgi:predicted transposase/invertase (TIGR01784 family)
MTKEELAAYNKFLENRQSVDMAVRTAAMKNRAEGKAEGLAEGRAEGLAEGEAKGKAEEKRRTAKIMKDNGMGEDIIAKITGLTLEEVKEL